MKTEGEIRDWVQNELFHITHRIRQCEEVVIEERHHNPVLANNAARAKEFYESDQELLRSLIAFLDEPDQPKERVFHLGGLWGDEYFDQDGIPEWKENPKYA